MPEQKDDMTKLVYIFIRANECFLAEKLNRKNTIKVDDIDPTSLWVNDERN